MDTQLILPRRSSFFVVLYEMSSLGNSNFAFFQRNFIDESAEEVMMLLTLTTLNKFNLFGSSSDGFRVDFSQVGRVSCRILHSIENSAPK